MDGQQELVEETLIFRGLFLVFRCQSRCRRRRTTFQLTYYQDMSKKKSDCGPFNPNPLNPTWGLKPKVVVPKVVRSGVDWTVPFGTARN